MPGCGSSCDSPKNECFSFDPCVSFVKCCKPCKPELPECKKPGFGKKLCARLCASKVLPPLDPEGEGWGYAVFCLDQCQKKVHWQITVHGLENNTEECINAGVHCASPKEDNTVDNLVKTLKLYRYCFRNYDECTGCWSEHTVYCAVGCWDICDEVDPLTPATAELLACGMLNLQVSDDLPEVRGQLCCYDEPVVV